MEHNKAIYVDDLKAAIREDLNIRGSAFAAVMKHIDTTATVEVAPVVHGRWERDEWGSYLRRCSVCKKSPVYHDERGNGVAVYAGVCIKCGAIMDLPTITDQAATALNRMGTKAHGEG